jgi:DNA-binding CsgD family transcriptional regulator/N-acetylneuraminic acid mutarotase
MEKTSLSEREQELLKLVATGASNKEISSQLNISINTVKVHLKNIFSKLDVSSRTEAAMWAVQNGLVTSGENGNLDELEIQDEINTPLEHNQTPNWWIRIPLRVRPWIIIGLACLLIILGYSVSQVLRSPNETPPDDSLPLNQNAEESRWTQLADMPTARAGLAAVTFDNKIYAIAGEGVSGVLNSNERYDPGSNTWEILNPKPVPVADVQAGLVGGKIYIPGGRLENGEVTDTLEIYDARTDLWSEGSRVPIGLSAYALVVFEGNLYIFGGWDGEGYLNSTYIYDPRQNSWTEGFSMPTARAFVGAAVAGGNIYVIGGYDGEQVLDLVEEYAPSLDYDGAVPWNNHYPMPESRYGMSVTSVLDVLYVLYGRLDKNTLPSETLIRGGTQRNEWENLSSDQEDIYRSGVSVIGTKIYIIGGEADTPLSTTRAYDAFYTVVFPLIQ